MSAGGCGLLRIVILSFVLAVMAWPQSTAPSAPAPDNSVERLETGHSRVSGGSEVAFRIRLLPVASFPSLPPSVAVQLRQKNCMVPQSFEARQPENVIRGAFERKGSDDWAALCSTHGETTLYLFFQSHPGDAMALRHQADAEWLGAEFAGHYGSAWGISIRLPSQIHSPKLHGGMADHSGIEDSYLEHSSTVHYFHEGEWVTLETGN
jgi:hypothetical protein